MQASISRTRFVHALILLFVGISGCGGDDGPELGHVTGKVLLGGQPLANATVVFQPEKGRPSNATTDENGEYTLMYTLEKKGALLGKHSVTISTYLQASEDDEGNQIPAVPERVPAEYNINSELTKEVTAGGEPINFELSSEGKIIQPSD